jgi:small neutral amino acid transporter SnatA (MarC family)
MLIVITTLAVGLIYTLATMLLSLAKGSGETFASLLTTFGFSLLPAFICVCVFHLVHKTFRWRGKRLNLLAEILLLTFIFNLLLFPLAIPGLNTHQTEASYTHYSSFSKYFKENMLESVITATTFAILIPLLNRLFERIIKPNVRQHTLN